MTDPEVQVFDGDGRDREADLQRMVERRLKELKAVEGEIEYRKKELSAMPQAAPVKAVDPHESACAVIRRWRLLGFRILFVSMVTALVCTTGTALRIFFGDLSVHGIEMFGAAAAWFALSAYFLATWRYE